MVNYLLDTCFIFHMLGEGYEKQLIKFCEEENVGITSFNLEEINYNLHNMSNQIKTRWRDFLKLEKFETVNVKVSPGNADLEKSFVDNYDDELLKLISDPSDAVLLVVGLKEKANIITKDKHHLFTGKLETYLSNYNIEILNNLPKSFFD